MQTCILFLIAGKLFNKPLPSKDPQDISHTPNHSSQRFRDTHGEKIHLETIVLQHLLNHHSASTGPQFPESTLIPGNMVGTIQQQLTKIGNNSLPGSPSCSGEETMISTYGAVIHLRKEYRTGTTTPGSLQAEIQNEVSRAYKCR